MKTNVKNQNQNQNKTTATRQVLTEEVAEQKDSKRVEAGKLYQSEDENSDNEWDGKINFTEEGDFWLYGFMKKDNKDALYMSLAVKKKTTDPEDQNLDRGVLFRNNRKKFKTQPDYTGNIAITKAGEYAIVANILTSAGGVNYMEIGVLTGNDDGVGEENMPF